MTPRAARLLRGMLLGGVATLLAAASHGWAGDAPPSPLAILLGGMFASLVGTALVGRRAGRRMPLARTIVAVAIGQLAFHLGFSLLGGGGQLVAAGGHHHEVVAILADPAAAIGHAGAGMWLAHLAAGVLTVLYLRHLEARVWGLAARIGLRVLRLPEPRVPDAPARIAVAVCTVGRPLAAPLRGAVARRGPPLAVPA